MGAIHYAIEIESGGAASVAALGMTAGYIRIVTDRPLYTGTDTGSAVIPTGDCSVIKINLNGTETIGVSFQSGQIYQADGGSFKAANAVPAVGDRFTVQDASDFTGGDLATAKGSAPAEGDMFEVTNNGSGTEAVKYVGVNMWYEDFLTRDGMSNPSRMVNLEGSGDYGTLSGFKFALNNCMAAGSSSPYWRVLAANSVSLSNRIIRAYAVISDVFYQIWTGIIDSVPRNEVDYFFVCKPNFKKIHKDIPPKEINPTVYPNSTDSARGKPVPICVGDIEYARALNVAGNPSWEKLQSITETDPYLTNRLILYAAATAYTQNENGASIALYTKGKSYAEDALAGKYLFVAAGGGSPDTDAGILILGNDATASDSTVVYLDKNIRDSSGVVFNVSKYGYSGSEALVDHWQFGIATIGMTCLVSNAEIKAFKRNSNNLPRFWAYQEDQKKYYDIKYAVNNLSAANGSYSSHATIAGLLSSLDKDGAIKLIFPIPIDIKNISWKGKYSVKNPDDGAWNTLVGNWKTSLVDANRATYITVSVDTLVAAADMLALEFVPLFDEFTREADSLYFGVDMTFVNVSPTFSQMKVFKMRLAGKDIYLRTLPAYLLDMSTGYFDLKTILNILPNGYYGLTDGAASEDSVNACILGSTDMELGCKLDDDLADMIKNQAIYRRIGLEFGMAPSGAAKYDIRFKEIGLYGIKSFQTTGLGLYTSVAGELLADDTESNTVYGALRLMLESYDGLAPNLIDYGNLPTMRAAAAGFMWHVGRQLTEKKNSMDYIKDLCECSFVAAFQDRKGRLAFSAWLDRVDTPWRFNETMIDRGSISDFELTSIDDTFNSFTVNFSRDPGGDKYFSSYQIKDVASSGGSPGGDLAPLWAVCRATYLLYEAVKEFKKDLPWFIDRSRWYNEGEGGDGLGTDGAAWNFLVNAVYWLTRQKRKTAWTVPINGSDVNGAANITADLCQRIEFRDPIYTDSAVDTAYKDGYIYSIEYDIKADKIKIGGLLRPEDSIDDDYGDIIESGSAPDTITESGSQPDTITEDGV